jgi:putative aldouronate transport system permease protein
MKGNEFIAPKKKKSVWKRLLSQWQLYVMMAPAILAMIIFHYIPMYGVSIAFREVNLGQTFFEGAWVGLGNFVRLFSSDLFTTVFKNTLIISLVEHFVLWPLPIIFALLVHNARSNKIRKFSQTLSYLPHLLSTVVVVSIIDLMCNRETGIINIILQKIGQEGVFFMGDPNWFRPVYFLSGIWTGMGSSAVVYIAALSSVDPQLIEAATIDGANKLQRMWHIDLTTIRPTIIILLIMNMGKLLSVGYEKVLLMQNDLNLPVSEIVGSYVYKTGVLGADYGFSTAVSFFNNIIGLILVVASNAIAKKYSDVSLF